MELYSHPLCLCQFPIFPEVSDLSYSSHLTQSSSASEEFTPPNTPRVMRKGAVSPSQVAVGQMYSPRSHFLPVNMHPAHHAPSPTSSFNDADVDLAPRLNPSNPFQRNAPMRQSQVTPSDLDPNSLSRGPLNRSSRRRVAPLNDEPPNYMNAYQTMLNTEYGRLNQNNQGLPFYTDESPRWMPWK